MANSVNNSHLFCVLSSKKKIRLGTSRISFYYEATLSPVPFTPVAISLRRFFKMYVFSEPFWLELEPFIYWLLLFFFLDLYTPSELYDIDFLYLTQYLFCIHLVYQSY